jgi:RNA polymerase sigma-70 factor (ECF subfamily)
MVRFVRNRTNDPSAASQSEADTRTEAFALLYDDLFEPVYRYCRIRITNPSDAEDMTAAIFAKAFASYPPEKLESTRSWLFAIAHNMIANHYRNRGHRHRTEPLDDMIEIVDPGDLPEQVIVAADERRSLHHALDELTGDQRQVIELRLSGLTGPEIAEILGRSHAAVKMLQLRAVERLRRLLDPAASIEIMKEEEGHARR